MIVVTGALGATLARSQGIGVLRDVQTELSSGGIPASPLVDGVIILIAAALLMTPGFLTDVVGFLCLVPGFRALLKKTAWKRIKKAAMEGHSGVFVQFGGRVPWPSKHADPDRDENNIEM